MFYDIDFTKKAFDNAVLLTGDVTEYRVKGKPHLRLRVTKTRKSLMVRVCHQGKRKSKVLGTFPMMKLATFERLANDYYEKFQSGELNNLASRVSLTTFFYKLHLVQVQKKGNRSWQDDESRFRNHIQPVLGETYLSAISSYQAQCLLNNLPEHLSDATHNRIRALLSSIFSTAIKYQLLTSNPCTIIPARSETNVNTRILSDEEYLSFIRACLAECVPDSDCFSFHAMALLLALFTGLRIGNCITITRDMLSADGNYVTIVENKQKKPQTVYLCAEAKWIVQTCCSLSSNACLFPSAVKEGKHISRPRSAFRRICKRAGIVISGDDALEQFTSGSPLHIHSLRKSFCSTVLKNTADIRMASYLLGHSDIKVTQKHYAFYQDKHIAGVVSDAVSTMTAGIEGFPQLPDTHSP